MALLATDLMPLSIYLLHAVVEFGNRCLFPMLLTIPVSVGKATGVAENPKIPECGL